MIYLDNAATSRPRAEALEAMWPYVTAEFGNPSSVHERGAHAAEALSRARTVIAEITGFASSDVIFTSGGTEADNLALIGLALASPRGRHVVSAPTEHEAVLQSIDYLVRLHGFTVSWVSPERDGTVSAETLRQALRADSTLVSLMLVNNEVGAINDVVHLAQIAHDAGALFHSDAVQAPGWLPLAGLGVDALTLSGHKIGAPQGIGVAVIRSSLPLEPTVLGGGQQKGRRSGTENVAGAVALATALALAERDRLTGVGQRVSELRDKLIEGVRRSVPEAHLTGPEPGAHRVAHIASFVLEKVSGEAILLELERRGVTCSSGSACAAGKNEPSHVLLALGYSPELAHTSVRFSLGHETDATEIDRTLQALIESVRTLVP